MRKTAFLFFIILVEGYVVLACELLAIRQLIPFVGSGTETVAIIISGVLLPLAVGYHAGGNAFGRHYAQTKSRAKKHQSIRKLLFGNILMALTILLLGLSYPFLELFFALLRNLGLTQRLVQTAMYALLFLVTPVFLLAQTVPLVSNYFSRRKLSEITGKMLFFSTTGSFLGSIFSTIVLMTTIGVHNTVVVTLGLLCILCILLAGHKHKGAAASGVLLFVLIYLLNSANSLWTTLVVSDNAYNIITVTHDTKDESAVMRINRSSSSKWAKDPEKRFKYVHYIDEVFIDPTLKAGNPPRDILILGAGGFTMGWEDLVNHYTFVDIDPALKDVSEHHFLPGKLTPNKEFVPASARAFVHNAQKKYDLIILDTYTNIASIPMETTTREYLLDVKKLLKDGGIVVANVISNPNFSDKFTVRYDNTFSSVFAKHTRQMIQTFDAWSSRNNPINVIYVYYGNPLLQDNTVYTDDKNTYSLDRK